MGPTLIEEQVAEFRSFNRFYTQFIGTLQEGLLESDYSLTEVRILYELATRKESTAKEIAGGLGLDAGYLSRILRKFEEAGLLKRVAWRQDGRHSILKLTKPGNAVFADLSERSNRQAAGVLEGLSQAKRLEAVRSMGSLQSALTKETGSRSPYILRQHRPGDMGWVIQRHGALYAQEYGWDDSFEALVARIAADFITGCDHKRERCWIAERDGEGLGCIFLVKHPERADTAKLRLLLVEPQARGLGLGKALVSECVAFARAAGYKKITLWTQSNLGAARHIYQQAGFQLVREEPHHSFGKDLVAQTWDLDL